jgi:hypothetical protein
MGPVSAGRRLTRDPLGGQESITMREPAHKILISRSINWDRAKERLDHYKNVAEIYPLETLLQCSDTAPFYCHYLAWRLGTWEDENLFQTLDQLIGIGKALPGWDRQSRVPGGCEFDKFWGFIWELQTAAFFADHLRLRTEWKKAGPDILVMVDSNAFFAECTTYRKSFALEEFVGELFRSIHPQIAAGHVPCLKFSLPKNSKIESFLDNLFGPYLDPAFLPRQLKEVQRRSPLELPIPTGAQNFYVYLEDQDAIDQNFELRQILTSAGDPAAFLKLALDETLGNKASSNMLLQNRPNMLMVNFLLGSDWQLARSLRSMPKAEFGDTYDGIFLTACGIDVMPSFQSSCLDYKPGHPIETLTGRSW